MPCSFHMFCNINKPDKLLQINKLFIVNWGNADPSPAPMTLAVVGGVTAKEGMEGQGMLTTAVE